MMFYNNYAHGIHGTFAPVATVHSAVGGAVGGAVTVSDTDREMEASQVPPQGKYYQS